MFGRDHCFASIKRLVDSKIWTADDAAKLEASDKDAREAIECSVVLGSLETVDDRARQGPQTLQFLKEA